MLWLSHAEFEHIGEAGLTTQKSWFQEKANWGKYLLDFSIVYILDHYTITRKYYNSKAFTTRAKRDVIPTKYSNHLTECKKGARRQHTTFTSCQNAGCSKNCFLWWVYYIVGSTLWISKCEFCRLFHTERSWHAYWFSAVIVSDRRDLPLQERFLRPLLKSKSLPLRLNKSFRLFILLQSASWIWIGKGDILLSVNLMVSFNFCHPGPSSFSIFCTMLNFHR